MSVDTSKRQTYMTQTVADALKHHQLWSDDNESPGIPPDSKFDRALLAMFEAFAYGDIPADCRRLWSSVSQLDSLYRQYVSEQEVRGEFQQPPKQTFWTVFRQISDELQGADEREYPLLPPPQKLTEQGITPRQIAKMYDWNNRYGEPDVARVDQELIQPSPEFKIGVPDPRMAARQRQKAAERQRIEEVLSRQQQKAEQQSAPPPESIEELIAQGLTDRQICKVASISLDELLSICREQGLSYPGHQAASQPMEAMDDEYGDEDEDDSSPIVIDPSLSEEQQILAAHDSNPDMSDGQIADALGVSRQKVTAVVKRREDVVASS